jgi:hypothetical protein
MKSIRVAVLIAVASFAAFSVAQDAPPGGTVEGTVINSVTGAGIGGALVTLAASQSNRYEATSDVAGHFKITGLAPGNYRTSVQKDGFAPPTLDLSFLTSSGLRVDSGDAVKLELKLAPFNTIAGRVLGPDGKPAAGMEVSVYPNITADVAVTDSEGRFSLENIRPGSYTLIAKPPASAQPEQAPDGTRTAVVPTYYPSVADRSLTQQIVLRGQPDFDGYEIRMQTAPVHRVRGTVLDEAGKPSPGAELMLFPIPQSTPAPMGLSMRTGGRSVFALGLRPAPSGEPEATAIAGEDGHFEFPTVRSGDWRINVVSDGGVFPHGSADAMVSRADLDDLQIHVAKPFNLTGTIEWKGEARNSLGVATLINPDGNEFVRSGIVDSGKLLFENILPGRYQLIVKPGLSAQIFLGENEVTGPFSVTADGPRLRIVLKTWSGTVRGTVEKGDGATVVLVPQRVDGVALGQSVVCGAGESFELSEVSPGDYYIAAFDHVDSLSLSAAMLSLVPSRGTSVTVEERSTANVTLSVIATPR